MELVDVFAGNNADGIKTMWIVTEYLEGGNLYEYMLDKRNGLLYDDEVAFYMKQVLYALRYAIFINQYFSYKESLLQHFVLKKIEKKY